MRCKVGDLVVIVNTAPHFSHFIGRITKTVSWCSVDREWELELKSGRRTCYAADEHLRPIRDPGDDAVDEVIQRLGTPHKEVA